MKLEPYLFFDGRAEEAIGFYEHALGARVEGVFRYRDSPEPIPPEYLPAGAEDKLMHASFLIGDARVMVSDECASDPVSPSGYALSLALDSEAEARRAFDALSADGKVDMPMAPTFWSPCFGMVTDRFGVKWMVTVVEAEEP